MAAPTSATLIDAVDTSDRHVGEIPREDALKTGANFRTVHIFVFNSVGDLLLQRLAPSRERHPGRWGSSVAAYLFAGETYEHAAKRRMREELSLSVALNATGKVMMRDEKSIKFVALFTSKADEVDVRDHSHISQVRFWAPSHLAQETMLAPQAFTPTFLELYEFYRRLDRNDQPAA